MPKYFHRIPCKNPKASLMETFSTALRHLCQNVILTTQSLHRYNGNLIGLKKNNAKV